VSDPAVKIDALTKSHVSKGAKIDVLKSATLEVAYGEFFVVVGPSGSGKSTLMRCIAGLDEPDAGEIRLGGRVVYSSRSKVNLTPQEREIGVVFQSYAIWPHLTVMANVTLPLIKGLSHMSRKAAIERAMPILERLDLAPLAQRSATALSGGQQQRVALARALASSANLILMDEPLSNLDVSLRMRLRSYLREIAREFGITVIYVTHDPAEALSLGQRIAVLGRGEVLQIGTPEELYRNPVAEYVAEALGDVNWVDGIANGSNAVATALGPIRFPSRNGNAAGAVRIGLRPDGISPTNAKPETNGRSEVLDVPGIAKRIEYGGACQWVAFDCDGIDLLVRCSPNADIAVGQRYWLSVAHTALFCLPLCV
jgi:iron(III) transport system ATP-binding protein